MQTDMIARKKANQLWVIIGVCSLGLSITACDNEMLSRNDKETAGAELRFDTSISDDPSTRANGASLIEGTAFPNGEHTFGMFITDGDGAPLVTGSDDNMRLTLTRAVGAEDDWKHTNKNDKEMPSLSVNHGGVVNISGYYPWVEGATPTAVPFDLTGDPATWKDLMYLTSPSDPVTVLDGQAISLNFSHAYCWVKVVLSKLTDKNKVFVGAVSITNSNNDLKRIINRGQIDPKTGNVIPATSQAGSIMFKCPQPIELILNQADDTPGYSPVEFNFLVPAFMSLETKDFEIILQVTAKIGDAGAYEILSFPINKKFLNNVPDGHGGTLFGFQRGMCNRYDIIYNNSEMALSLASWDNATIPDKPNTPNHQVGQQQQQDVIPVKFNNQGVSPPTTEAGLNKLPITDHRNHDLLGEVADGNNGDYVTTVPDPNVTHFYDAWGPFLYADKFNPSLQVSKTDAAGGGIVPWKDAETGVLRAKQACIDFKGGGYTDWRLPRLGELGMLLYFRDQMGMPSPNLTQDGYWSATEHSATEAFCAIRQTPGDTPIPRVVDKTGRMSVRCVRDLQKPNPGI